MAMFSNVVLYLDWHFLNMLKWLKQEDDMVSTIFQCPDISNFSSWFLDLFNSQSIYVDGKQTLLLSVVIVSAIYAAYYFVTCANNISCKKKLFITKTGELYNMTETTQYVLESMTCIMHVWGQSMGMVCVHMQSAWSVMIRTNPSARGALKRRLPVAQIQRSMRSVVTDFLI